MNLEMDDIYSAAYLGLIKAAEKFDKGRAVSFSTFAIKVMEKRDKDALEKGAKIRNFMLSGYTDEHRPRGRDL